MQVDAMLRSFVLQGLAQERQWSLGIKIRSMFERKVGRKLGDKAFLLLLLSYYQQVINVRHD